MMIMAILYVASAIGFYTCLQRTAPMLPEEWEEPTWVRTEPHNFLNAQEWPPYPTHGRAA